MHKALVQLLHKVYNRLVDERFKGCEVGHGVDAADGPLEYAVEVFVLGRKEAREDLALGHGEDDMVKVGF
jgi:hypothetical protein